MNITINGSEQELTKEVSLTDLLEQIGMKGKPVVIELNQNAVFPREFNNLIVKNGDSIEIITIAAGG